MNASTFRILWLVSAVAAAVAVATVVRAGPTGLAIGAISAQDPSLAQVDYRVYLPTVVLRDTGVRLELRLSSQIGGSTHAIVADGRRAWAGIGPRVVAFEIDADDQLQRLGAGDVLPGIVQDLALADGHLYALVRGGRFVMGRYPDEGVYVFDVSTDPVPRRVGTLLGLGSGLTHIVASPSAVFVTDNVHTVWTIDIADPSRPRVLSQAEIPSLGHPELWGAAWHAGYLYVVHFDLRFADPSVVQLAVLDARDTAEIEFLGTVPLSADDTWYGGELLVDGDQLFWLSNDLVVMSLADPARPVEVPDALFGVDVATVADDRLYAMGDRGGVVIIDVTDPVSFTVLGGADLGLDASHLAVGGGFLFGSGGGVAAVDAREPGATTTAGACRVPGEWARHVAVGAAGLFVPESDGVWYWPDPADAVVGCPRRVPMTSFGSVGPMAISGSRGFLAEVGVEPAAVCGVDLSAPGVPRIGGRSADLPLMLDVAVEGEYAFAVSVRGLHIVDGSDVDAPLLRDSIQLYDGTYWSSAGVAVDDGLLAVAGSAIRLFDVANPESPLSLASLAPADAHDIALHRGLAFVSGSIPGGCVNGGLHVLDVGNPRAPRYVAAACESSAGPIAVTDAPGILGDGSLVFVGLRAAWPSTGTAVVAYFVPPSGRVPVPLALVDLPAEPMDLAVSDDGAHLCVADRAGGLFGYEVRGGGRRR